MLEIVIPGVPGHYHVGVRPTVVTRKRDPDVGVTKLLGESGAVDSWWIATSFGVDEESCLSDVPLHRV